VSPEVARSTVRPFTLYTDLKSYFRFVLIFYPSWSIWSNVRDFINHSGTDDILQRLYVLLNMIVLLGYSANATSIEVEHTAEGHTEITHESYPLIHAAVGFLLAAKAARALLYLIYAFVLPKFRIALSFQLFQLIVPCLLWLPLTWLHAGNDKTVIALAAVAIGMDMAMKWVHTVSFRWSHDVSDVTREPN
jgi:hypothetical protein